ncbi:MAG: hypothetical protein KGM24_05330 [Elusimicrobia bacterium]|nr:hypothetical protein [Elusimicrobiota bacterium]
MRTLLAILLAVSAAASAAPAPAELSGYLSSWRQDCSSGCLPPVGEAANAPIVLSLAAARRPGEARTASFERTLSYRTGERVRVRVVFYDVCPRAAAAADGDGGGSCPSRYVQVQTTLSGDASAFCAASLNLADAEPFPVVACGGADRLHPGVRLGVSLHRAPLGAAGGREAPGDL